MYKYTPDPVLLEKLEAAEKAPFDAKAGGSPAMVLAASLFTSFGQQLAFLNKWKNTRFYNFEPVKQVPVGNHLLPVELFVEEKIEQPLRYARTGMPSFHR